MDKPTNEPVSAWYASLALLTKRGKVVNEQDLPAPVRKLSADEIAALDYTAPRLLQERDE